MWYSKKKIMIIITRTTENKPKVESQFNDFFFFFYESQWVGKLSILSIRASAGPPKAPPPGFGTFPLHHQMQVDNTENVSLKRPSMLTSAYFGSCRAGVPGVTQPTPQRLPGAKFLLPPLHTMQTVCRCGEMMYGCWKSRHQTEDSSYVTEKGVSKCVQ